jgi:hypothetical protein
MNRKNKIERVAIDLRGSVPADHPLNQRCFDVAPKTAFKMMLNLAEEADNTRNSLERLLTDDHPLRSTVRDMTPQEALAFLIGHTRITSAWHSTEPAKQASQGKQAENTKGIPKNAQPVQPAQPEGSSAQSSTGMGVEVNFDDEEFLLFSGSPTLPT